MVQSDKYEMSRNLVLAYRSWAEEVKVNLARPDSIVYMDDLSNVPREKTKVDWNKEFAAAVEAKELFNEAELLKVHQSIAFAEYMTLPPSKDTVQACGGEFGLISESEIKKLSDEIYALQNNLHAEQIESILSPKDFAIDLVNSGMTFLQEKMPWLYGITTKISYINPDSPFGAQVITDHNGDIVCELRIPEVLNPKFIDTLIHEFLGHVLHFTQLKNNEILQQSCPHLLCLTLHTHEPFFIEAIAQLLSLKILHSDWPLLGKAKVLLENAKFRKSLAIVSFVVSQILEGGISQSEAAKLHCSYSGDNSEQDRFEKVYSQTLKDLFVTKVRLNYHQSIMAVYPLLSLSDVHFYDAMRPLLNNYYTPAALRSYVDKCLG